MAALDQNNKDDLKTQFVTREGTYRLMTLSEYSRPNRVGYQTNQNNPQVRVSLVSLPLTTTPNTLNNYHQQTITSGQQQQQPQQSSSVSSSLIASANGQQQQQHLQDNSLIDQCNGGGIGGDRICFNFGKELYVYAYRGCKKLPGDLSKPIDKKLYKGTNPSCHDFNEAAALNDGAPLLVGFTTGQIQLVQPGKREPGRLYNEDRFIDKTKVTCLKWLPKSTNLFLASHSSGHLYLYNEDLPCTPSAPNYQPFKSGEGYSILTCKSKTTRNPLYKWTFGNDMNCCINEFCFSPCGQMLAIVSQDGFLRVFNYDKMELIGVARSYFGGFLCVCWSPDGKYIVVGGEDDLVTVWSLHERRVVARGQGHRSWVSVVAFDPFTSYSNWDGPDFSDDENPINDNYLCYNNSVGLAGGATTSNDTAAAAPNNRHMDYDDPAATLGSSSCNNKPRPNSTSFRDSAVMSDKIGTSSYRLGSVSQDTQLCLWDITEDILRQSYEIRQRLSSYDPPLVNGDGGGGEMNSSCSSATANQQQQQLPGNDVKVINPILSKDVTVGGTSGTSTTTVEMSGGGGGNSFSSKNSSNSSTKSGSKFATANCTSGSCSGESGRSSINEQTLTSGIGGGGGSKHLVNNLSNKQISNYSASNSLAKSDSSCTTTPSDGNGGKSSSSTNSSTKTESGGLSAFGTSITQRLSNFSFGNNDKKSDGHHNHHCGGGGGGGGSSSGSGKKSFTFSKSTGNHASINAATTSTMAGQFLPNNCNNIAGADTSVTSLKNSKTPTTPGVVATNSSIVPSYDPMQLIGTPLCPRFDECPLLEPLICKKIAHERLTALIFREDCFLTACQDGFIYTWARPGFSNIPQHISASPSAPPAGGTVV